MVKQDFMRNILKFILLLFLNLVFMDFFLELIIILSDADLVLTAANIVRRATRAVSSFCSFSVVI